MMSFLNDKFIDLSPGVFFQGTTLITGAPTTGTCLMEKAMFDDVNGYSEQIKTLPGEDLDLYRRLMKSGYKRKFFPFGSLKHISHPYYLRTLYRPWFGMSRAKGTRVSFKQVPWNRGYEQLKVPYGVTVL
jgi:GT2 family glycosyltransferase